jgi:hypothetical protein
MEKTNTGTLDGYIPQEQKTVNNSLMILNSWNSERTIMYSLGSVRCISTTVNNSLFISMWTMRDLPQQKKKP